MKHNIQSSNLQLLPIFTGHRSAIVCERIFLLIGADYLVRNHADQRWWVTEKGLLPYFKSLCLVLLLDRPNHMSGPENTLKTSESVLSYGLSENFWRTRFRSYWELEGFRSANSNEMSGLQKMHGKIKLSSWWEFSDDGTGKGRIF